MRKQIIKGALFFLVLLLITAMVIGCSKKHNNDEKFSITKEEAYNLYYDTIKKFVPELMDKTKPPACDVDIKTREEVTFLTEHFVRNTTVKIQSQNVDGKWQYYLLNQFPEANKKNFYVIDNDEFYGMSCALNAKGTLNLEAKGILEERNSSYINHVIFPYLNTPLFPQDAISSFKTEKKNSDIEITFIVKGDGTDYGYGYRVMKEILPNPEEDKLDDTKIVLTIDEDGVPKTMSTEISMSIYKDSAKLHAQKILNMDFTFNKLDNVDFDLKNVVSQYALDASSSK